MKIIYEPTKYHKYAFDYKFSLHTLEFCRWLKQEVGWKEFNFSDKKWRFNDITIIDKIKGRFPELEIDEEVNNEFARHQIEQAAKQLTEKKANEIKQKTESTLDIKGIKGELYPYQKVGVEFFINNNGRAILADQMGCLSGDTKIIINRGGNARQYTLKELYTKFNNLSKNKQYKWDLAISTKTRSLDKTKKEFQLNTIKQVVYSGKQQTIEIKAKTQNKIYTIQLTKNHPIMSSNYQWIKACKLKVDDKILVNGKMLKFCSICKEKTEHSTYKYGANYGQCKKCIYKFKRNNHPNKDYESFDKNGYILVGGLYFHPYFKQIGNNGIRKHILVYEAFENKTSYKTWINACRYNKLPSNAKFIDPKKYSIHHKNGIKNDNRLNNLKKCTILEHCKLEGRYNTYKNLAHTFIPTIATIISIKDKGIQDVYDIVMADPHRNFIANGIVVHNCGKSVQALAYIVHQKIPKSLVICPASVKYSWENEVKKWTYLKPYVINSKSKLDISIFNEYEIFIINYDILAKFFNFLQNVKIEATVIDEFHYIKSNTAQRTKLVRTLARHIPSILLLSGTPMLSRPVELYNGLNLMDPHVWSNWMVFTKRYCGGWQSPWGWDCRGATNIPELQEKISRYFLRRKKEDVLPELPPKNFIDIPIKLDIDTKFKYDLALESFIEYLREVKDKKEEDIERSMQAEKLVRLGELRQLTTQSKIKPAEELIKNILDSDQKLIVFSCYNEPLEYLEKKFKKEAVLITGKTPELFRASYIEQFQKNPKIKLFLGGIKSTGVGITLTAASNVMFIDYSWVPADHQQAQDRCIVKGQLILTKNGYKQIEDVVVGDQVWSHKGNWDKVINKKQHSERNKLCISIEYKGFNVPLKLTEDHKIYVYDSISSKTKWIQAKDIKINRHYLVFNGQITIQNNKLQQIQTANPFSLYFKNNFGITQRNTLKSIPEKIKLTNNLLFAFGYYVANGWSFIGDGYRSSIVGVASHSIKKANIGYKAIKVISKTFGNHKIGIYIKKKDKVIEHSIHSKVLAYNFKTWFGNNAHTKHFPDWCFQLNKEQIKYLLRGYYAGDGHKRRNTIEACTVSTQLLSQLFLFQIILGHSPYIEDKRQYSGVWNIGHTINTKALHIKNKKNVLLMPIKKIIISKFKHHQDYNTVYDLETANNHSFVVGIATVHNCHRPGQTAESITVYQLFCKNTIDQDMQEILASKQIIFDKLIEGTPEAVKQGKSLINDVFNSIKKANQLST